MLLIFKCFLCIMYSSTLRKLLLHSLKNKWFRRAYFWELRLRELRQLRPTLLVRVSQDSHLDVWLQSSYSFHYILVQGVFWTKQMARQGDAFTFNKIFLRKPVSVTWFVIVPGHFWQPWGCSNSERGSRDHKGVCELRSRVEILARTPSPVAARIRWNIYGIRELSQHFEKNEVL